MNPHNPKAREGDLVRLVVDVDGYLSKRIISRGTDGVVVEAYSEPQEGYAVDVITSDQWSPEGLEFDSIVLRPDEFEVVPYPCTVRIDARLGVSELAERLAKVFDGESSGNVAASRECCFQVFLDPPVSPEARVSDFSRFRHRVEGEARPGVPVERMATIVGSILEHFWAEGIGAVALCHYRDLLPGNGGGK